MGIFTSSSGRRGRTAAAADQADAFKPILTTENSAIPGQVVVQLHASASDQVTTAIGAWVGTAV